MTLRARWVTLSVSGVTLIYCWVNLAAALAAAEAIRSGTPIPAVYLRNPTAAVHSTGALAPLTLL